MLTQPTNEKVEKRKSFASITLPRHNHKSTPESCKCCQPSNYRSNGICPVAVVSLLSLLGCYGWVFRWILTRKSLSNMKTWPSSGCTGELLVRNRQDSTLDFISRNHEACFLGEGSNHIFVPRRFNPEP